MMHVENTVGQKNYWTMYSVNRIETNERTNEETGEVGKWKVRENLIRNRSEWSRN